MEPGGRKLDSRVVFVAVLLGAAAIAAAVVLLASGGDDQAAGANGLPDGCEKASTPPAKHINLKPPPTDPPPAGTTARVQTSCGEFTIALDTKGSPKTTASFAYMVGKDLYTNTPITRIAPGFVVQGGDPTGTGRGGPGYSVDERPPKGVIFRRGSVAMAKAGFEPAGRSGSQFFVVTAQGDAGLAADYAALGKVVQGFDVVKRIESAGEPGTDGPPPAPIVIDKITLELG